MFASKEAMEEHARLLREADPAWKLAQRLVDTSAPYCGCDDDECPICEAPVPLARVELARRGGG